MKERMFLGLALGSVMFSAALLFALAWSDPKRRRAFGVVQARINKPSHRRALAYAAILPGGLFLLFGQGAAFLLWLGAATLAGWWQTLCFSLLSNFRRRS